jgi:hypothetical protein
MLRKTTGSKPAFILLLFLGVIILAAQTEAQTKIAGKMTMVFAKTDSLLVADAPGHLMTIGESKGTNTSVGESSFMDGSESVNYSYSDIMMGNGAHQGYVTHKSGDDMTVTKWQGKITTTMSKEGAPITTFAGTFEYVKGTGKYQGISGKGTYQGQFTSETEYTVEWQGEYTLK